MQQRHRRSARCIHAVSFSWLNILTSVYVRPLSKQGQTARDAAAAAALVDHVIPKTRRIFIDGLRCRPCRWRIVPSSWSGFRNKGRTTAVEVTNPRPIDEESMQQRGGRSDAGWLVRVRRGGQLLDHEFPFIGHHRSVAHARLLADRGLRKTQVRRLSEQFAVVRPCRGTCRPCGPCYTGLGGILGRPNRRLVGRAPDADEQDGNEICRIGRQVGRYNLTLICQLWLPFGNSDCLLFEPDVRARDNS